MCGSYKKIQLTMKTERISGLGYSIQLKARVRKGVEGREINQGFVNSKTALVSNPTPLSIPVLRDCEHLPYFK